MTGMGVEEEITRLGLCHQRQDRAPVACCVSPQAMGLWFYHLFCMPHVAYFVTILAVDVRY